MSGAWGTKVVGSAEIIDYVWKTAPTGSDGDTVQGLILRLPQTGERAREGDVGKRFDGARPAAPIISLGRQADDALLRAHAQFVDWENDLPQFGYTVYKSGSGFLDSGFQALKIAHADSDISDSLFIRIANASRLGALDINSPEAFADSAYAARNAAAPTRANLWVDKEGNRKLLSEVVDYGAMVDERPFKLPLTWRA